MYYHVGCYSKNMLRASISWDGIHEYQLCLPEENANGTEYRQRPYMGAHTATHGHPRDAYSL